MLEAIRSATKTITFETYIYWSGEVGEQFSEALSERARAGVKVHVLLDWVGSGKMKDEYLDGMKSSGVEVEKYHPLHWYNLSRINNRTTEISVVDAMSDHRVVGSPKVGGERSGPLHWPIRTPLEDRGRPYSGCVSTMDEAAVGGPPGEGTSGPSPSEPPSLRSQSSPRKEARACG